MTRRIASYQVAPDGPKAHFSARTLAHILLDRFDDRLSGFGFMTAVFCVHEPWKSLCAFSIDWGRWPAYAATLSSGH
jgi:hypothetical protein